MVLLVTVSAPVELLKSKPVIALYPSVEVDASLIVTVGIVILCVPLLALCPTESKSQSVIAKVPPN